MAGCDWPTLRRGRGQVIPPKSGERREAPPQLGGWVAGAKRGEGG